MVFTGRRAAVGTVEPHAEADRLAECFPVSFLPESRTLSCRTIILPILSILSWLALLPFGFVAFAEAHRNVVLIVTDDQGLDLGCYGNTAVRTPNLDALAADGTRFTRVFATTASCSASRSVILTGLHNHANRQYSHVHTYHHFHTARQVASLPRILNQHGYRTARVGKFHVGPDDAYPFGERIPGNASSPVEMADAETLDRLFEQFVTSAAASPESATDAPSP